MKDYEFSFNEYGDTAPRVPDYMRRLDVKSAYPQQILYAKRPTFRFHEDDGRLLIDVNDPATRSREGESRIPFMRIYEGVDGVLYDGYIADLRHFGAMTSTSQTDIEEHLTEWGTQDLLAAVGFDPIEETLQYYGDRRLKSYMEVLLRSVDGRYIEEDSPHDPKQRTNAPHTF